MCGIAGFFLFQNKQQKPDQWPKRLETASNLMQSRGPDDQGTLITPDAGVAHRRLAIIDLAGGKQPFSVPECGLTLVYNGEIYNYRDIKKDLQAKGHIFHTKSDTEVLLHAYMEWDRKCLQYLSGMFAFAILDTRKHTLFLARDRLGVKPLFWTANNNHLCFASAIPALQALSPDSSCLSPEAISHYLSTIRINLGSQTILKDIHLLEPGTWMLLDAYGKKTGGTYWEPTVVPAREKDQGYKQQMIPQLQEHLDHAIAERLMSDVPLGGFLSGGLDSSIIASQATRMTQNHYHAYSVGYPESGFNEFAHVSEAASAFGMHCQQITLNQADYPAQWKTLIQSKGLPLTTPNEIPIQSLAQALRKDYTVALSGEGADEVFGGYTLAYFSAYDYQRAASMRQATSNHSHAATRQALMRAYGRADIPSLAWQHLQLNHWLSPAEKQAWLHPDIVDSLKQDEALQTYYHALYDRHPNASILDRIMLAHLRVNLEGLLLRVDSSTMAASVEARVPFTDHKLVDYALQLPDEAKLQWRTPQAREQGKALNVFEIVQNDLIQSKCILRDAYRQSIPHAILQRPKMSFPVPVFQWMTNELADVVRDWVANSPLRHSLLNPDTVDAFLNKKQSWHPVKLWPIVNLCLWDTNRPQTT